MALKAVDFNVFEKYKDAPSHAFSRDIVDDADKDTYQRIFAQVVDAVGSAVSSDFDDLEPWNARFGRNGGVQGQRPVDLWASLINKPPDAFERFPQIYMIAAANGFELGFSVAIHEDDYYNSSVKEKNREIMPLLYSKLPDPNGELVRGLDELLGEDGEWKFGVKTRQRTDDDLGSLAGMIRYLQSSRNASKGGGAIYKIIAPSQVELTTFDLRAIFSQAVERFLPLMKVLRPSSTERLRLELLDLIRAESADIEAFDPASIDEGKKKLLRHVAIRQGQLKFRNELLDAYGGRCVITGTSILGTLQAAHIVPYSGPGTNSVSNGLLLRADVHNLFDLGLLQVDPDTFSIFVSEEIRHTNYGRLHNRKLRPPAKAKHAPSVAALRARLALYGYN